MDLSSLLNNPLFVPLVIVALTFGLNAFFLYWLRKWQYKAEYIVRNVDKTYIPLTAEIHDRLEQFNKFVYNPDGLHYSFEKLDGIRKAGLFEFIRSHDKKLYDSLVHFYTQICPRFKELADLQTETRQLIRKEWDAHIESIIEDKNVKQYGRELVSEFFKPQLFTDLLNGGVEEISKKWNESLARAKISRIMNISQDEVNNLLKLAQPKIQKLLDFYGEIRTTLDKDVINDLIPRLQKYISNPIP